MSLLGSPGAARLETEEKTGNLVTVLLIDRMSNILTSAHTQVHERKWFMIMSSARSLCPSAEIKLTSYMVVEERVLGVAQVIAPAQVAIAPVARD